MHVRWIVELNDQDAERLEAQNAEGESFILKCGSQSALPISVTEETT